MSDLNRRFLDFLRTFPAVESLDATRSPSDRDEYADFAIEAKIIVEVKSLENDPSQKVDDVLAELSKRPDFPTFYGTVEVRDLLKQMDGGIRELEILVEKVTRALATNIRKGNRQIRSTIVAKEITEPTGLLVLLNEDVSVLNPKLIAKRAAQILASKDENGNLRYPAIDHIWIHSETHVFFSEDGTEGFPSLIMEGFMGSATPEVEEIFARLQMGWAAYRGRPFKHHAPIIDIAEARMTEKGKLKSVF